MQEYMLERSEKKSCEDASDDRVIRNIRNVIREKEELKEQRKSGSFMYGVSAFLVVVIIVIGINLMNNYEKMKRLNQSVDNLMNQLEGNERGGQDGDDNGVHDSEASGDISVDGNAIKVNRLSGDVYPWRKTVHQIKQRGKLRQIIKQPLKLHRQYQNQKQMHQSAVLRLTVTACIQ